MDLNIWMTKLFYEQSKIEWHCPNCYNKSLKIVKDSLKKNETVLSKKMRTDEDFWEIEWITEVFSGILECANCGEPVMVSGYAHPEQNGYYDHGTGEYSHEYDTAFYPTFFEPALPIFQIPKECPENVREEINNSFKLFWFDLSSCANKIRSSLELLMNEENVKRYEIIKGKRQVISLHKRIENYKNSELIEYFLAVKWIGNIGSHVGDLERVDILNVYKVLEFALNKIYDNTEKEVKKITKSINKSKGVPKKK